MNARAKDVYQWTLPGRALVFVLAASSIWCLLAEFYGLCSMQTFTFYVSIPALILARVFGFKPAQPI